MQRKEAARDSEALKAKGRYVRQRKNGRRFLIMCMKHS